MFKLNSKSTPKELSKKRLIKSKLMKIPLNEGNFDNKENVYPEPIKHTIKATRKKRDIVETDVNFRNPYNIPFHLRLFSESKGPRKVKPEPFIMSNPHTVKDINPTFYKIIEGRPLRQPNDVKVYMRNIRDITLFKANAAYLKDQIIQIDTSFTVELEEYRKIDSLFQKTKSNFVQFAKESYDTAKKVQAAAEVTALKLADVVEEIEGRCFKYVELRNKIYTLIYTLETLTRYRKFLFSLSPASWQDKYSDLKSNSALSFANQTIAASTSASSINEYKMSISKFKEMKPRLYFKQPWQLMATYNNLSQQCLNYMKVDALMSGIVNSVKKKRDVLKTNVTAEVNETEGIIEMWKLNIKYLEAKEKDYRTVFEGVLVREFQRLYASFNSSKLFTCVQYVSTRIFEDPEDPKDSVVILMKNLERLYLELTSKMDDLDQKVVKEATKEFFAEDIKMMNRAHKAHRELKECDILWKALYSSFEPPRRTSKWSKK